MCLDSSTLGVYDGAAKGPKAMLVVAMVSTKGGTGKSTLAECLAVEAVRLGRSVFIVDLDAQQSTAAWWRRRLGPDNPMLITGRGSVIRALREVQERQGERDVMIIDTPGSDMRIIREAMNAADVIVVAVQPSLKDLEAQGAVADLIKETHQTESSLYVVNRADGRSNLAQQAVDVVRDRTPHEPLIIAERADYVRADAVGKAGNEVSKAARGEIQALWNEIERIASNGPQRV
jgi:chromosome partitioning protein